MKTIRVNLFGEMYSINKEYLTHYPSRPMGNSSVMDVRGTLHTKINILASISRKIFVYCYFLRCKQDVNMMS